MAQETAEHARERLPQLTDDYARKLDQALVLLGKLRGKLGDAMRDVKHPVPTALAEELSATLNGANAIRRTIRKAEKAV